MGIWRLPIWQKSVRFRLVVSCAHSKGRLVFPSGATCSISELKPQNLSCCTRTTLYLQSRWKSDSLTSQLSIEASVRSLELRQDGGEEQTYRCRRRSTSPRLKRSKGRHSRFPPTKAQQKRQTAALSIKTRIETSKTMGDAWLVTKASFDPALSRGIEPGSRATANFQPAACPQFLCETTHEFFQIDRRRKWEKHIRRSR